MRTGEQAKTLVRENLAYLSVLSHEALADAIVLPSADHDLQSDLVVEFILYSWLLAHGPERQSDDNYQSLVRKVLSHLVDCGFCSVDVSDCVLSWLNQQVTTPSFAAPGWLSAFPSSTANRIMELLSKWSEADGCAICIAKSHVLGRPATLLPFYLLPAPGGRTQVSTGEEHAIPDFECSLQNAHEAVKQLDPHSSPHRFSVRFPTLLGRPSEIFSGKSIGLPLLAALYGRRERIPTRCKNPLAQVLTGVIDPGGCLLKNGLNENETQLKMGFLRAVGVQTIIAPGDTVNQIGVIRWPTRTPLKPQLDNLLRDAWLPVPDVCQTMRDREALSRISWGMRTGTCALETAESELREIRKCYAQKSGYDRQKIWAESCALLAACHCHKGDPGEVSPILSELKTSGVGKQTRCLAMIFSAVALTDMMDYAEAVKLCNEVLDELGDEIDDKDLYLEAYGTRGQALTYWGLLDSSKATDGLRDLLKAESIASDIDGDTLAADAPVQLPRNMNYLCLWSAYHGRESFGSCYSKAINVHYGDQHNVSREYLTRIRWLAAYRAFLAGEDFDWREFEDDMPKSEGDLFWLRATSLKYRAALRAHGGDMKGAKEDFAEAITLCDNNAPLMRLIGATVAAQATLSFDFHDRPLAENYRIKAQYVFRALQDHFPAKFTGDWAGSLETQITSPQLIYPY